MYRVFSQSYGRVFSLSFPVSRSHLSLDVTCEVLRGGGGDTSASPNV